MGGMFPRASEAMFCPRKLKKGLTSHSLMWRETFVSIDISSKFPFLYLEAEAVVSIFQRCKQSKKYRAHELQETSHFYVSYYTIEDQRCLFILITHEGFLHRTFQMSAVAHGYVSDETEALVAFQGIIHLSTPAELHPSTISFDDCTSKGTQHCVYCRMRNCMRNYTTIICITITSALEILDY